MSADHLSDALLVGELRQQNARLKKRVEKLKAENEKLHEGMAIYRERYQSLVNKLVAKVDEVGRG